MLYLKWNRLTELIQELFIYCLQEMHPLAKLNNLRVKGQNKIFSANGSWSGTEACVVVLTYKKLDLNPKLVRRD